MKKLILCIICAILPLFGANSSKPYSITDTVDNDTKADMGSQQVRLIDKGLGCAQPTDPNLTTEIIGYDFEKGLVECRVRDNTKDAYTTQRSIKANKQYAKYNFSYIRQNNLKKIQEKMTTSSEKAKDFVSTSTSKEKLPTETSVDTDKVNLSHYLASLATLQNIKPEETAGTAVDYNFTDKLEIEGLETKVDFKIAQAINQANIEYFRELYYGMNEVYIHLQNLLFIVVGGFFLATLGGQKIQKYLENRGQSTGQKEPYLHKFFIPLLCAGVFYMPITESGGVNSTMIQNIIRYFTNEATTIADKASRIGLAKYTKKFDREHNIRMNNVEAPKLDVIDKQKLLYFNIEKFYLPIIEEEMKKCTQQYADKEQFFEDVNEDWLTREAKQEVFGVNAILKNLISFFMSEQSYMSKEKDFPKISLEACKYLAKEYTRYFTAKKMLEKHKKTASTYEDIVNDAKSKTNTSSEEHQRLETTSEKVFLILNRNETEYGWLNSLIAPASVMLLGLQKDAMATSELDKERITKTLDSKKITTMDSLGETADEDTLTTKISNFLLDKVVVFMLPGSQSIYKMIVESGRPMKLTASAYIEYSLKARGGNDTEINLNRAIMGMGVFGDTVGSLAKGISNIVERVPLIGKLLALPTDALAGLSEPFQNLATMYLGVATIYFLYMDILEKLPLIIVSIAGILAFITYFVSLCKYYYISPFVVAFALTTKRVDKIINFLMIGITIFFKPVLIVLFIYLALFLHGIVYELFIITSVSQFNSIMASSGENSINFGTQLTIGVIKTLLQFFGSLGSCYIVWKTIMTGPDWVFKMLGLETSATSEATQQLAGKLEQKAVVI